jgi:hypothetical protein
MFDRRHPRGHFRLRCADEAEIALREQARQAVVAVDDDQRADARLPQGVGGLCQPMPPSSAITTAISARVTVSMLAETIGRRSMSRGVSLDDRSRLSGSRRSTMLY